MDGETLANDSQRGASSVAASHQSLEKVDARRILIADNDENIREIISSVLSGAGFEVNAAADGEQAWQALHREHFDLLVTDNDMPYFTGIELVERMRDEGMSLPVIFASGNFFAGRMRSGAHLHIAAVLLKPFDILEFVSTVRQALQVSGGDASAGH